jgi:hypothetical protein
MRPYTDNCKRQVVLRGYQPPLASYALCIDLKQQRYESKGRDKHNSSAASHYSNCCGCMLPVTHTNTLPSQTFKRPAPQLSLVAKLDNAQSTAATNVAGTLLAKATNERLQRIRTNSQNEHTTCAKSQPHNTKHYSPCCLIGATTLLHNHHHFAAAAAAANHLYLLNITIP